VSSVRLARGSPAFGPRLGGLSEQDGVSPPVLFIHHVVAVPVLHEFLELDVIRCLIFGSRVAVCWMAPRCTRLDCE
jgi:hypothetical protein